jgi:ketosteroid isomerase-like protein/muconolactone delta-isomerase
MKWNYQGRISQKELWEKEAIEGEHAREGLKSGMVKCIYKAASQHRIIAIVDVDSIDNLDRNSMGWLPMREYLEFEKVWPLREYESFLCDVRHEFPKPAIEEKHLEISEFDTRRIAEKWFDSLSNKKFDDAIALIANDVVWQNIPKTPGITDIAPWLGTYHGLADVKDSFGVWAKYSTMLSLEVKSLVVSGNKAVAVVHEHAQCLANKVEYDLFVSTHLTIEGQQIKEWSVYWDPSPLVRAYRTNVPQEALATAGKR